MAPSTVHAATYTNHDSEVINLNDGLVTFFAKDGLPRNLFTPTFRIAEVDIPSNIPASSYQGHIMEVREIPMTLWIKGTPDVIIGHVANLIDYLWLDIRDSQRGTFQYTAWNLVTRSIKCALSNISQLSQWINEFAGVEGRVQLPIVLRCQDPTFYDSVTVNAAQGTFNDAVNVNVSCINAGNADAYPRITYTGIVESPKVTDSYGNLLTLEDDTTHALDTIVMDLDPLNFSVTYTPNGGSATSWANKISSASKLPLIAPGTNNLTFVSADGTPSGNATIDVAFESRYAAHGK